MKGIVTYRTDAASSGTGWKVGYGECGVSLPRRPVHVLHEFWGRQDEKKTDTHLSLTEKTTKFSSVTFFKSEV